VRTTAPSYQYHKTAGGNFRGKAAEILEGSVHGFHGRKSGKLQWSVLGGGQEGGRPHVDKNFFIERLQTQGTESRKGRRGVIKDPRNQAFY